MTETKCEEKISGEAPRWGTCSRNANSDPDSLGIPTKCGTHSVAGKARRKQKLKDRYAKERAGDDAQWAASDARKDLAVAVRVFLDETCIDQVQVLDNDNRAKFHALLEIIESEPRL